MAATCPDATQVPRVGSDRVQRTHPRLGRPGERPGPRRRLPRAPRPVAADPVHQRRAREGRRRPALSRLAARRARRARVPHGRGLGVGRSARGVRRVAQRRPGCPDRGGLRPSRRPAGGPARAVDDPALRADPRRRRPAWPRHRGRQGSGPHAPAGSAGAPRGHRSQHASRQPQGHRRGRGGVGFAQLPGPARASTRTAWPATSWSSATPGCGRPRSRRSAPACGG